MNSQAISEPDTGPYGAGFMAGGWGAAAPAPAKTELRAANAVFEAETCRRDVFAAHTVVGGNLVTGENQNSGYETAQRILDILSERSRAK